MKTNRIACIFLFAIMSLPYCGVLAGTFNIKQKNGDGASLPISNIKSVKFVDGSMKVALLDGEETSVAVSEVQYLSFSNLATKTPVVSFATAKWNVYPNPVKDVLNISYEGNGVGAITCQLLSLDGKLIGQEKVSLTGQSATVLMNVAHLAAGMYVCRLFDGEFVKISKIIKH